MESLADQANDLACYPDLVVKPLGQVMMDACMQSTALAGRGRF